MSYMDIARSPMLYMMVGLVILYVIGFAALFGLRSYKRALEIGFSHKQIREVIKSSAIFTIVPSIAIVIGLFSLVGILGIPLPWLRLSVIGSVSYELMAADTALKTLGADIATASGETFGTVMYVMTLGILTGLILVIFTTKKIQSGTMKMKNKDGAWGTVAMSTFMTTIAVVFLIPIILKGGVYLLTLLTSAAIGIVLALLSKKESMKWLHSFTLAFCLIGAMTSSVFWTWLIERIGG